MTTPQVKKEEQLNMESVTWGNLTWVNIECPTERETGYLAQTYHFHPLDLDDCLSRIQRPKIDEYKDYLFLVFHFPVFSAEAMVTAPSQLSVFISSSYLITLHKGEIKPLVHLFRECQVSSRNRQGHRLLVRHVDRGTAAVPIFQLDHLDTQNAGYVAGRDVISLICRAQRASWIVNISILKGGNHDFTPPGKPL